MRLVHLTDPHLSSLAGEKLSTLRGKRWSGYLSWRKNRRKNFLPAVLDKLTEAVKAENADQILLTGDLVHIGLETEMAQASEWLNSLGSVEQVMLVPGNHDIYARDSAAGVLESWSNYLFQSDPQSCADMDDEYPVLRKRGKLSFIGVSTACVTPVFMASGKVGDEQLARLAELLEQAAAEDQMVILSIHHPPLPGMTKWRKALSDADKLEDVLDRHPPMLSFHGHLHHNRERQWGDSRIYCTSSASSVADASYRVIDIEDKGDDWAFHMTLKSIAIDRSGEAEFLVVDDQTWQVAKK